MLIFGSTGVNLRSRVRTFLEHFLEQVRAVRPYVQLLLIQFTVVKNFPQCNRFLIRSKILSLNFLILQALFWVLAMNCPEGIFQKHQILLYVSFFVTILLSFHFNSSLTRSLRSSRLNRTFHCHPPPLLHSFLVLWHDLFVLFIRFQLVLYLSFFLIIQILVKFCLMLHKSH